MKHLTGIVRSPVQLTRAQARAVDRIAGERYEMPTLLLMENAARSAADVALAMLSPADAEIVLLAGPGNNGGDALAMVRHLVSRGGEGALRRVRVALLDPASAYSGDAQVMFDICARMGVRMVGADVGALEGAGLVVDGMFGTGLTRALSGVARELAEATAELKCPVLALDIPSGLDADSGEALGGVAVRATRTVTFVGEKVGFGNPGSLRFTGEVVVGEIGVPWGAVVEALGG